MLYDEGEHSERLGKTNSKGLFVQVSGPSKAAEKAAQCELHARIEPKL